MADTPPIGPSRSGIRLSYGERDAAAERLREAAAEGRLSTEELDQRLTEVFSAVVAADLEPLLRDLPEPTRPAHPDGTPLVGGTPGPVRRSVALLGTIRRADRWVVPTRYTAAATFGTVELDLRDAVFQDRATEIHAYGLLGTVRVVVPPGVRVEAEGRSVLGPFGRGLETGLPERAAGAAEDSGVVVRLVGLAAGGAVQVVVREPERGVVRRRSRLRWWIRIRTR
jgi:hypothetical protein